MKIVADSKIPYVREAFADVADVDVVDTQAMTPATIRPADAIIIRSETLVDERLIGDSAVKFVATSTIGIDHVDTGYLERRGVGFASAPGSNANSVAEYLVAALLVLAERQGGSLAGKTAGVVGVGNVGKRTVRYLHALGMKVLQNDPPLARVTGDPAFLPLDQLMSADIITLHVPLTKTGRDRTHHLFDEDRIRRMKAGSILVNTSRGAVVETGAVKRALRSGHLAGCVLDVWEGEPAIDVELLGLATLGTAHIAGYSFDGKVNGVAMIHKAVCEYFGLNSAWLPPAGQGGKTQNPAVVPDGVEHEAALLAAVRTCYDIEIDDRNLRRMSGLPAAEQPLYFRRLRAEYRIRREFTNYRVMVTRNLMPMAGVLKTLGFTTLSTGD